MLRTGRFHELSQHTGKKRVERCPAQLVQPTPCILPLFLPGTNVARLVRAIGLERSVPRKFLPPIKATTDLGNSATALAERRSAMTAVQSPSRRQLASLLFYLFVSAAILVWNGCGGGNGSATNLTNTNNPAGNQNPP